MKKEENKYTLNKWVWFGFFITLGIAIASSQSVTINNKPSDLTVFVGEYNSIHIQAKKRLKSILMFSDEKKLLNAKTNRNHIILNTTRLKKGNYAIKVVAVDSTYNINFNKQ